MNKCVSSTTLRDNFADTLKEISKNGKYFLITKKGRPVSVMVNLDFFEDLLALHSKEYVDSIKEARKDYKAGDLFSHNEVFGSL